MSYRSAGCCSLTKWWMRAQSVGFSASPCWGCDVSNAAGGVSGALHRLGKRRRRPRRRRRWGRRRRVAVQRSGGSTPLLRRWTVQPRNGRSHAGRCQRGRRTPDDGPSHPSRATGPAVSDVRSIPPASRYRHDGAAGGRGHRLQGPPGSVLRRLGVGCCRSAVPAAGTVRRRGDGVRGAVGAGDGSDRHRRGVSRGTPGHLGRATGDIGGSATGSPASWPSSGSTSRTSPASQTVRRSSPIR